MFDLRHEAVGPAHLLKNGIASSGKICADLRNTGFNLFEVLFGDSAGCEAEEEAAAL